MEYKKITKNFNEREFACKGQNCCNGYVLIDYNLVIELQKLRDFIQQKTGKEHKIIVTRGYSCPKHNAEIGGAPASGHISGHAIDSYCEGLTLAQYWLFTEEAVKANICNFSGKGSYPEETPPVIHLDNLPRFQRWVKRNGKYYYLF
jgi:uncharacterized protein YcbK (DUF882 family)